ncbi:hypothetical protein F4804DRAFT_114571 [Jackrogersella minutella]|nr:hypothetical protein F4804DRAFT_114571 [Jackrogersella minutella]
MIITVLFFSFFSFFSLLEQLRQHYRHTLASRLARKQRPNHIRGTASNQTRLISFAGGAYVCTFILRVENVVT